MRPTALAAGAALAATVLSATVLSACGGSTPPPSATSLLSRARATLDATRAVHFVLTSSGVPSSGTSLTGGAGDLVRPDALRGSFTVRASGVDASVAVVSAGGRFYARLPFATSYTAVNPATLGLGDPASLLSPTSGVSALLTDAAPHARLVGSRRLSGELVDEVTGTVPGSRIPVLPDADRAAPVRLTADIVPSSSQLRRVSLAGPFDRAGTTTTYTVTLTGYGEHVAVRAPGS